MTERPLTAGEIDLARTVFGSSIDYSTVKIFDKPYAFFQPKSSGMSPNGNIYMHDCYSADYSAGNAYTQSFFIHEMTHVWQFQNKVLNPIVAAAELTLRHKFNYLASYEFILDEKKDLIHYGMEQQAAIVEEYFLTVLKGFASNTHHCKNTCGDDERRELYEKVLKNFLKNPAYAKQAQFPKPFRKPKL